MKVPWAKVRNYLALQLLWLAAVGGAGRGWWWAGPLVLALWAGLHFGLYWNLRGDALLMLVALLLGAVVDTVTAATGLIDYAAPWPSSMLAPVWILSLWMGLGLTLNHSFAWLMHRPAWVLPLMAIGGPLSYLGAQASFSAVQFTAPQTSGLIVLGALWAAATGVLVLLVARIGRTPAPPVAIGAGA